MLLMEYREGFAYPAEGKVFFALGALSGLKLIHVGSFFSLFSLFGASWALLGRHWPGLKHLLDPFWLHWTLRASLLEGLGACRAGF